MNTVHLKSGDKLHTAFSNVPQNKLTLRYSKVIFFLHGFPDDNTSFDGVIPSVLKAFHNQSVLVLAPVLRGYEKSSQHPFSEYKTSDLAKDVYNFITQNLSKTESTKIHLVGHDWGAICAFKTASLYPDLIDSIATLAIPYISNIRIWDLLFKAPKQFYYSAYFFTMQSSYLYGSIYSDHSENSYLNKLWEYWSPGWNYTNGEIEHVRNTLQKDKTLDHAAAYYKCLFNPLYIKNVKWYVDFKKVPTLMLGGRKDGCMSYRLYEIEQEKLKDEPNVRVQLLSGVGHFLHREDPEKVADVLIDWLESQ